MRTFVAAELRPTLSNSAALAHSPSNNTKAAATGRRGATEPPAARKTWGSNLFSFSELCFEKRFLQGARFYSGARDGGERGTSM